MTNSVAKKENSELAKPSFMKGNGRGSENVGIDDLTIPRLDLLQALSPQRDKKKPEYIDGAEEGMLFNSVSKKLYGEEVVFIPVYFRKEYVIWKDRKKGGGFCGAYPSEAAAIQGMDDQNLNPEDHDIVDTAQHFGLIVSDHTSADPEVEEIVISMAKSKMKVSRQLNTLVRMAGGDRFERGYEIAAFPDTNNNGEEFYNLQAKQLGYVSEEVYKRAEMVYDAVSSGTKDVNRDTDS